MKSYLISIPLFLFFQITLASAVVYYSGSSYFFDFPKCVDLNITVICEDRIDANEFYFSPNCNLVENQTFVNKWVCNCFDGYVLNFTINPGTRNKCNIYMIYTQELKIEEKREIYFDVIDHSIVYNYTYNYTCNQTEKLLPYIPEDINQTINELNQKLEEKEGKIKELMENITTLKIDLEKSNLLLMISSISVFAIILILIINKLIRGGSHI